MTTQELKKELTWMKRVTKDTTKTDETVNNHYHPKYQRFIKGLLALGAEAEAHDSREEWLAACDLCGAWNQKYPAEIWMTDLYDDDNGNYEAHIEDETFRFTA